jgi:hypothetical protein
MPPAAQLLPPFLRESLMAMDPASVDNPLCPACGAQVQPTSTACWLCQEPLASPAEIVEAELVEPTPPPIIPAWEQARRTASPLQFSLESLMLVITLVAVCLGMIVAMPGVGVLVAIVAAPALVRTLIAGFQQRAAGSQMTLSEKALTFLASTGITMAVLAAGGTAFASACFASCLVALGVSSATTPSGRINEEYWIYIVLGFSSLVGLATTVWLFWLLRPQHFGRRP